MMDKINRNRTSHPARIYLYAMIIFWIIYNIGVLASSYLREQDMIILFLDGPIIETAILGLVLGGCIWLLTRNASQMSNQWRAILVGLAIGFVLARTEFYDTSNGSVYKASLYRPLLLIPICLLSASFGEGLARRPVDTESISKTFE